MLAVAPDKLWQIIKLLCSSLFENGLLKEWGGGGI